jgi:6-pyruvoyltetrahydropterin/6-carboxytetrahydropterin synthase
MYRISREFTFCYGHRLVGHNGKCRHLHGHNGKAVITLESSTLDDLGMVVDFGVLKRILGGWIDENLDHRMILHKDDPATAVLLDQGEPIFVVDVPPTAENIARMIFEQGKKVGLPIVEVLLWETDNSYALYRETGGESAQSV